VSPIASRFAADATAEEVVEGIDLRGRTALVTGGSTGLGAQTARALALAGAHVVLTGRTRAKAEKAAADITEATGQRAVEGRVLDLASESSIRDFAQGMLRDCAALHLLVLNAGLFKPPQRYDAHGREMHFAANHLGHFLLTKYLLPRLLSGAPARVVVLSSAGHHFCPVVFDDLALRERDYDPAES
jgi:NAD(P)-dependent dehydrogenase (short-subunit alcohol dehydrogenase family)